MNARHRMGNWLPLLVAVVVLAGCKEEVEADCQQVGPGLLWQIQRVTATSVNEAFAVPSRTESKIWLVGAQTAEGVAVWSVTLPPDGEGVSFVLAANQAAVDDAIIGMELPPVSDQPEVRATKDKKGIAAAEGCLAQT